MALILFGGFEMGNHNGEFQGSEAAVVVPTGGGDNTVVAGGRSGVFHNRLSTYLWDGQATAFNFPTALSEFFFQVALASNGPGSYSSKDQQVIRWRNGTTVLGGILYNFITNMMDVYVGDFVTPVGSFPAPPGGSVYWVFEIHLIVGESGLIEIRRDMNAVFTFSGDTQPGAATTITNIQVLNTHAVGYGTAYHYIDDFVLTDPTGDPPFNSWPNGLRITRLVPNADAGPNAWTPTPEGAHYPTVDESPPSGTDYLQALEVDLVESFGLTDLPGEAQAVYAIKVVATAFKASSLAPDKMALGVKLGDDEYYSDELDLLTGASGVVKQWIGHPDGVSQLSVADVNAMKLLMKAGGE
jgi:hypothetical protein